MKKKQLQGGGMTIFTADKEQLVSWIKSLRSKKSMYIDLPAKFINSALK